MKGHLVPVTSGCDATPVPAHPQYCERRGIIVGLCGLAEEGHKCSLDEPVKIENGEAGFRQIVELIRSNVWASYIYAHILQPQVDWLPLMNDLVFVTCKCYDHKYILTCIYFNLRSTGCPRCMFLCLQLATVMITNHTWRLFGNAYVRISRLP